jgi:acetoacetyl-CoA synthetase
MGVKGIVERFSQLKPKLLVCETEVVYGGRTLDLRMKLEEANRQLEQLVPELQCTIVVRGPLFAGHNM